jgi:CubicO group peptidase (beta-lactamase class C family)
MFTGLMLEQLVEADKVQVSDPVEKYYPQINEVQGFVPGRSPITLMQLGLHTSGLSREPDDMWKFLQGPTAHWETPSLRNSVERASILVDEETTPGSVRGIPYTRPLRCAFVGCSDSRDVI